MSNETPAAFPQQQQQPGLSREQVADAAAAGCEFLQLDTTLVPGNLRQRLALLELILQQVATGRAVLANPQQPQVESPVEPPATDDGNKALKPVPKRTGRGKK